MTPWRNGNADVGDRKASPSKSFGVTPVSRGGVRHQPRDSTGRPREDTGQLGIGGVMTVVTEHTDTAEFFGPYNYDFDVKWYANEVRAFHADALADLGRARIDVPLRLDGAVAQWIDTAALAQTVADRHTRAFGTGVRLWTFTSSYAYPELEVGDMVAIKTTGFVMRDPVNNRGLRGHLWVMGRICAVHDVLGTKFTIWIKDLSDIAPTCESVELTNISPPSARVYHSTSVTFQLSGTSSGTLAWDSEVFDLRLIHDTGTRSRPSWTAMEGCCGSTSVTRSATLQW